MSTEVPPGSPDSDDPSDAADAAARATSPFGASVTQALNAEAAAAAEAAAGPITHLDDLIADLRRQLSDVKDKNLRLLAEMENLRRRTEDEKSSSARYAIQRFATDIVAVGDNFQRAISAVPDGAAETDPALNSLLEGVELTEREFLKVLEQHGVKRIVSKGALFSPHFHQPMMQVPDPSVPAGTILQVFQDGYTIGDRLLRAAVVTVAEGGPKAGTATTNPAEPSSNAGETEPPGDDAQPSAQS